MPTPCDHDDCFDREICIDLQHVVDTPDSADDRITTLRRIVERSQWEKIDGYLVDGVTANLLVQVYDGLTRPEVIEKFNSLPLESLVAICWRLTRQEAV